MNDDLLGQVHTAVIRLDAKVDNLSAELRYLRESQGDHEARLRMLENRPYLAPSTVWKVVGSFIGFSSLAVAIIGLVVT